MRVPSRQLSTLEKVLRPHDPAGPVGVAHAADAAGNHDGVLTGAELDTYAPQTSSPASLAPLRQLLDLPAAEAVTLRKLTAPQIVERKLAGSPSEWFDVTSLGKSPLFAVAMELRQVVMNGAPDAIAKQMDVQEYVGNRTGRPDVFSIHRDVIEWGLKNIDAFYEHETTVRAPADLETQLTKLLAAVDKQGAAKMVKVAVVPPEITPTRLPLRTVQLELITEVTIAKATPGLSASDGGGPRLIAGHIVVNDPPPRGREVPGGHVTMTKRYLAVAHDERHHVIVNVTPQARGAGQAEAFEAVVRPHDDGVNRLPRPPVLDRGEAARVWVQVVDKESGSVVENRLFEVPANPVPKISVKPGAVDHWETTEGKIVDLV